MAVKWGVFQKFIDNGAGVYIYVRTSKGGFEHVSICSIAQLCMCVRDTLSLHNCSIER